VAIFEVRQRPNDAYPSDLAVFAAMMQIEAEW